MEWQYRYINLALFCWATALVSWCLEALFWAALAAAMTFLTLFLHMVKNQVNVMFGKDKSSKNAPLTVATPPHNHEKEGGREDKQNTVIAHGTQLIGNVTATGQMHIFGTITGNIDAKEGIIKVMRNGMVEGNILCRELFIDGAVNGECFSETINIEESGAITGTLTYSKLTIKNGGIFSGQAKLIPAAQT